LFLGSSFVIIWAIVIWMLNKEFNMKAYEVAFTVESSEEINDTIQVNQNLSGAELMLYLQDNNEKYNKLESLSAVPYKGNQVIVSGAYNFQKTDTTTIRQDVVLENGATLYMVDIKGDGNYRYITEQKAEEIETKIEASVIRKKDKEIEVAASWFGVLNSLFIILFAPVFSKIWESKYNPSAPIKFALGLILLGAGFGILAFGAMGIEQNAFGVSMIWLILAYLMHTLGELTLSPVGLSYVSKLAPAKLISFMFGIWFTATAVANYLAGKLGSLIDSISEEHGLSAFFLIFTFVPIGAGLILIAMNKWLLKKMHGIR